MVGLRIGLICCFLVVYAAAKVENGGVNFEVGGKKDDANIKRLYDTLTKTPDDSESGDGSGDDDTEIYSGSGSGEPITEKPATDAPKIEDKTKPPTKQTKLPPSSTMVMINEVKTTKKAKTTDEKDENENENEIIIEERPTKNPSNKVGASRKDDDKDDKSNKTAGGIDFTVGIIVGVVVGAILAILVIVFLVYRLRKKDEGSYSLDEPSSVAFIRDEKNGVGQEKEYFA